MNWAPGLWLTKCGMKATIVKIFSKNGKWVIRGTLTCPTTGILAMAEWDYHGAIKKVTGINTEEKDFNLTTTKYEKEG